jgi:PAS domain S-box-containing protein
MPNAHILVVEDEIITAEEIRVRLQHLGYSLAGIVDSGEEALTKVVETHPDLVLMDIQLGKTMDGITAAEEIRERFGIPVVYLTAFTDEETLQRAKITEPSGYIVKPLDERTLHIAIDIALYKHQTEQAFARQQALLVELFEGVQEGIAVVDECAAILFCNPAYAKMVEGVFPDNLIERNAFSFFEYEARSWLIRAMKDSQQGEAVTYELPLITLNGKCKDVRITMNPRFDNEETWVGEFVTMLDITDRKQTEQALQESEGKYRSLIEHSIEGIALVEGVTITFANQALADMFGAVRKEEMIGCDLIQFVSPEYRDLMRTRGMARERGESMPKHYEFKARRLDGTEFDATIAVDRFSYHGNVVCQAIISDITEDRQTEHALQHATLTRIHEDLRVPAEAMVNLSNNLQQEQYGSCTPQQREMLSKLATHSQQILETLNRMFDRLKTDNL